MKETFGERLELNIHTTDSEEAKGFHFTSSTQVLLNRAPVPLDVATDRKKMEAYLLERI